MSPLSPAMSRRRWTRLVCGSLLLAVFLALCPLQKRIDRELGTYRDVADVLYIPSGNTLRHLCLGYDGLLSNIYWTRVVQYFGRRRLARATRYDLLGALLRVTTELDPHLIIAYRFGAIFLAEKSPGGAGQPQAALQLLRRGIVANPDYWRLWQDLGFIYYWDLKDYETAARIFQEGSRRPGAMLWMKALAASVAVKGGDAETSRALWLEIYRYADGDSIRASAEDHLKAIDAQMQLDQLNELLEQFEARQGYAAGSLQELVAAGFLRRVPKDPAGLPYEVGADGRARLAPQSKVDLRLLQ